jgi:hypothetical protein
MSAAIGTERWFFSEATTTVSVACTRTSPPEVPVTFADLARRQEATGDVAHRHTHALLDVEAREVDA